MDAFVSDLYRATFKTYQTYTQKKCFDLCLQKFSISECVCHNDFYNCFNNKKACEALNEFLLIAGYRIIFIKIKFIKLFA